MLMVFVKTKRNRNKFRYNFRVFLFWYPVSHSSTRVYECSKPFELHTVRLLFDMLSFHRP